MKLFRNDGSEEVRFTMRMESRLYEKLKESAIKNKRSIAKELEFATEHYISQTK